MSSGRRSTAAPPVEDRLDTLAAVPAKIGFQNLRIVGDGGRFSLRDHTALVQDGDPVGEGEHPVDIVFNQQHRMASGQFPDHGGDPFAVGVAKPGQRFVEQQQFRLGRQRHRNFEQALFAMCQIRTKLSGAIRKTDGREQRPGLFANLWKSVGVAPQRTAVGGARLRRHPHRLEHRQIGEYADNLEGAREAGIDAPVCGHAGDVEAPERQRSTLVRQQPGQHVEEGRLAGSVGSDQAVQAYAPLPSNRPCRRRPANRIFLTDRRR